MITLYLASYIEKKNFGSGKSYSITHSKPENFISDGLYEKLTPSKEILDNYYKNLDDGNQNKAIVGDKFTSDFKNQLFNFVNDVKNCAVEENKSIFQILPFCDGDTFLSWEREGFTNYRYLVAECLTTLGYNVVLK